MHRIFVVAAGILILLSAQCRAESYADSLYNLAHAACYNLEHPDYEKAAYYAFQALDPESPRDKFEEIKFREILAYAQAALDQPDLARKEYFKILLLYRYWRPDPQKTPPKVLSIFDEALNEFEGKSDSDILSPAQLRLNASLRSLVLPGWGQYYKGQKARGAVVTSLQVLSLATLVILQSEVNRRHNIYENKEGNEAISAYDEYKRAWRARNVVGYVAIGVYVGAYLDALYTPVRR